MTMQELSQVETEQVSGAFIGDAIQASANLFSGFFNFVAPLGQAMSLVPGAGIIHEVADRVAVRANDAWFGLGSSLGGKQTQVKFHYEEEKAMDAYNPIGIFKFLKK